MTPAILAVFNASPFGKAFFLNNPTVSGAIPTNPAATAVRRTVAFSPTSTIRAAPSSSMWEKVIDEASNRGMRGNRTATAAPRPQTGFEDRPGHQAHAFQVRFKERFYSIGAPGAEGVLSVSNQEYRAQAFVKPVFSDDGG
jgi:hypothetical protein